MWEIVNKPSPTEDTLINMARAQDKAVGTTSQPKTFFLSLEAPINAISTSRDWTQIAVAGRNVFKILDINESWFTERTNLRVGRINLNFSITDVLWHHLNENIIATAAGNGAVILWDLNRAAQNKQDHVFYDHKRTVNKICFHPTDASILLSSSQDGTINQFDLRRRCVALKFFGRTADSIRDVQFNPFDRNLFAAACESGNIQLWDMRRTDHCVFQFTGHNGPVFSLDWHPEDRSWLGTGGRDKTIKVWNTQSKGVSIFCVPTIAEVACVRWRPKEKFHISSCALVVDHHVSVWDVRRPYIPMAAFTEHQDVATGMVWHKESDILFSCSKDANLYQHVFHDAMRPAEHAPPVGLGISCLGDVGVACSDKTDHVVEQKKLPPVRQLAQTANSMPTFFKKAASAEEDFMAVHSTIRMFNCKDIFNELSIELLAKRFITSGRPFSDLCTHNAKACQELKLYQKAQTWQILKLLLTEVNVEVDNLMTSSKRTSASENPNRNSVIDSMDGFVDENGTDSNDGDVYTDMIKDDEMDLAIGADLDAIFQDEQFDGQLFTSEVINEDGQEWTLPNEAFQPRHTIGEKSLAVDHGFFQESSSSPSEQTSSDKQKPVDSDFQFLRYSKFPTIPEWDFKQLVVEMLHYFAEQGDVQMAVTALLVVKDKIGDGIDDHTKEEWFLAYLELLNRLKLWTISTRIIKESGIPSINLLNQDSTLIKTICGGCSKPVKSAKGWYCERCHRNSALCAICHLPVKGLYAWCQGCGHGGHLMHMRKWIQSNQQCPAGCGHRCQYS